MFPSGTNLPPTVTPVSVSCSLTNVSSVMFSINKVVAGTTVNLGIYLPNLVSIFNDTFTQNVKSYNLTLPDGVYLLIANNGSEDIAEQSFTVACGPATCDLVLLSVTPGPTSFVTGLGLAQLETATTHGPLTVSGTVDTSTNGTYPVSFTVGVGTSFLTGLEPGAYDLVLTDAARCSQAFTFTIGPAEVPGCLDAAAHNYNPLATVSDNSCVYLPVVIPGCRNPRARNYNAAATVEDGSCLFGPEEPVQYDYANAGSIGLVYNEPEKKWVAEQTNRPQLYMGLDGRRLLALPLPGQANTAPGASYLWEHNSGPPASAGANPQPGVLLYGRRHPLWVEVVILGAGAQTIKNLDNLVLVASADLPYSLVVTTPEQGTFTQTLVGGKSHLTTVEREEQLTYVQLYAPEAAPWGNRVRAQYVRLRVYFNGQAELRLSKLFAVLRESLT